MAFIAPLLGAGLAAGGATFFVTAAGQAVLNLGLAFGASYLSKVLMPGTASSAAKSTTLSLRFETNEAREVALGRCCSAGSLKYHHEYGPHGADFVQLMFVLADHTCDENGLERVIVNGEEVTLYEYVASGDQTGWTVLEYPDVMWIEFHNGDWNQAADVDLVAHNGDFSANNRGRGVCYVRVTMKFKAKLYPNGLPTFLFVFRGAKLYDPRQDSSVSGGSGPQTWGDEASYVWSDNAAVCLYNWERGIYVNGSPLAGMYAPEDSLPFDNWIAAMNSCDEEVDLNAGGTEPRYQAGGIVAVDTDNGSVVRDLVAALAGVQADCSGVLYCYPGVSRNTVADLVDADLIVREPFEHAPKLSRSELINAVFGTFQDETQLYQSVALPPRISPDDQEADGNAWLPASVGLAYVQSNSQGQRCTEIMRRKGRFQRRIKATLRAGLCQIESGDWISWTSARYGFVDTTFEVLQTLPNRDMTMNVELREISSDVFSWFPATDELDPLAPAIVSAGGSTFSAITGFTLTSVLVVGAGAAQRPALQATWDPIDDETVTGVRIEYRRVGDTVAVEKVALDPTSGELTWLEGIQGDVEYEARAVPITEPVREVTFTGWTSTGDSTDQLVVDVALIAETVPPGTITPAMLSAQTAFELSLMTAREEVLGSVQQQINAIIAQAQQSAEDALSVMLANQANAFTIQETRAEMGTLGASWGVQINNEGHVVGLIRLDGTSAGSMFAVVADSFVVAQPGEAGGDPRPVFTIAEVDGETRLVFVGDMFADGSINARHLNVSTLSAISANFGDATFEGVARSADNRMIIDFDAGSIRMLSTT